MGHGKFGTAINCMDGRCQGNVIDYMKLKYGVDHVDNITEPGVDGQFYRGALIDEAYMKKKISISTEKHGSDIIVIAGHYDCAGNPVEKEDHIEHIKKAVDMIHSWSQKKTVGLWVNENFEVEEIGYSKPK